MKGFVDESRLLPFWPLVDCFSHNATASLANRIEDHEHQRNQPGQDGNTNYDGILVTVHAPEKVHIPLLCFVSADAPEVSGEASVSAGSGCASCLRRGQVS